MAIPRVSTCCCGCTLETGTKVIAWLDILASIAVLITSSSSASLVANASNFPTLEQSQLDLLLGIYVTMAIVSGVQLVISSMLLYGATKRDSVFVKPWLFYCVVEILMLIIMMIVNSVIYSNANMTDGIVNSVLTAIINICLKLYFMLVVYSFYRDLVETPDSVN